MGKDYIYDMDMYDFLEEIRDREEKHKQQLEARGLPPHDVR